MPNCLWLYGLDCSPSDSSVYGIIQARILEWFANPNSGIELMSLVSPALAGRFFTNSTTWEAPILIVQFSSVQSQSCPTLCNPMNCSTLGLPVHHQLLEFTHTHVHRGSDAIQPSHPLSSPSPPAPKTSQHQGLFQWVNSSHEVAKVLEFQL